MYVIRETFTCKPGMASKFASQMKSVLEDSPFKDTRVLTDAVGAFNTVVMETQVSDLGEFEKRMKEYGERADLREKMKGYTEMYQEGRREIFKVV